MFEPITPLLGLNGTLIRRKVKIHPLTWDKLKQGATWNRVKEENVYNVHEINMIENPLLSG